MMRRTRSVRAFVGVATSLAALSALSGCHATHVVYARQATLGIDIHAAPADGNTIFTLGYDQSTFAIVPRYVPPSTGAADKNLSETGQAMSVTALSQVYSRGLSDVQFGHLIATGKPAAYVARDGSKIREAGKQVFGNPAAKAAEAATPDAKGANK